MEKVTTLHGGVPRVSIRALTYSTVIKTLVERGKIVTIRVNGIKDKECHGIFTMRTAKDADNVIKHMNGSKIGDHVIQIEKRARDPTKPKEPKANKEV